MAARLPDNELERLDALREHHLLDTAPQAEFDDLVRLAAHICGVPIAAVSLIDEHRQWFKAIVGLTVSETPRNQAFCAHTILQPDIFVIQDAQADPRFSDNPLVTGDPNIRFYAGVPLITEEGYSLGSLCVIDRVPKILTPEQETALQLLARQVSSQIRGAKRVAEREMLVAEKERLAAERQSAEAERLRLAAIIDSSDEAVLAATLDGTLVSWNKGAERLYGYSAAEMIGQHVSCLLPPEEQATVPAVITSLHQGQTIDPIQVFRERRDGTKFYAALSFSPIHNMSGEIIGLSCIARDITATKTAANALTAAHLALTESEERLRRLTDAAFEGIAISQDGVVVDASPAFAALFGYDAPTEMIGLNGKELAAPESRELVAHKVAVCDEEPYEATLMRRDKTTFQAELRGRLIQRDGRPARVTAVRDITERKEMEQALRESNYSFQTSQKRLAEAQQVAQIGSWEYDTMTGRIVWSDELFRLFDMDPTEGEPSVEALMLHYHPDDVPMHAAVTHQAMQDGLPYEFDIRIRQQYDAVRWVHAVGRGERDESGNVMRLFGTLMDIHERKLAEERFRVLFDHSPHAHLLFNSNGGIIDCNAATLTMMRCADKAKLLGTHPALLSPEYQPDGRRSEEKGAEMCALARENGGHRFEWQRRAADGHEYPVEVTLTPVTLEGRPVFLSVWQDLTERKHAEAVIKDHAVILEFQKQELERANAELEALATTDGLTGLKNHRAFQERLAEEISRASRYSTPLSLILLDVDRFKQYNDTHGHPAGDAVLKTVARLLQDCARDTDLVARYGGEEFVLVLPQTDREGAAAVAERVRASIEGNRWPLRSVTASFGVAALQLGAESSTDMIARADKAMYQSKTEGRNRVTCGILETETPEATDQSAAIDLPAGQTNLTEQDSLAAVLISDLTGKFLQVSTSACGLLGFHEDELVGTSGYDLIHPDDIEQQGWRMDDVAAGQIVVTERRLRRKDGSWMQAELRTQQMEDGRAECVLREVTMGRRAEELRQEEAARYFTFMQDVLASVTEGRLILCRTEANLPQPFPEAFDPISLTVTGGLRELRSQVCTAGQRSDMPEERIYDLILAAGEAGMNSVVHVGEGTGLVSVDPSTGAVQVRVTDHGAGISWEDLPSATLRKGYSSAGTLGHGMKIMLQTADRIFLLTGPTGTTVVIEQNQVPVRSLSLI